MMIDYEKGKSCRGETARTILFMEPRACNCGFRRMAGMEIIVMPSAGAHLVIQRAG